jgi:membrane protein required for colicin V production
MTVEPYDLVMLAVLIIATAWGAWKGVAWQIASLAAIFVSYVVAFRFRDAVAPWIPVSAPWRVFLAMLLLFIGSSLAIWMVFRLVSRAIDRMKLKEFDRQVGALLGLAKGVVMCVIITLFAVTLLGDKQRQAIVNSRSGFYIAVLLSKSHSVIPEEFRDVLNPYVDVFDGRVERAAGEGSGQGRGGAGGPFSGLPDVLR